MCSASYPQNVPEQWTHECCCHYYTRGWRGRQLVCQCSDHTSRSKRKLLKMRHTKSLPNTCRLRTWITGTMSWGLIRPKITYLDLMVPCLFWDDQGKNTKTKCIPPTVKRGVRGSRSGAAGTGELQFIEGTMNARNYCDILMQSMVPSLRKLGCRAIFQHF